MKTEEVLESKIFIKRVVIDLGLIIRMPKDRFDLRSKYILRTIFP